MPINVDNRLHRVFTIGGFLDCHSPRMPFSIHSPAVQRTTNGNQITGDPLLLHQSSQMIGGVPFANG